MADSVASTSALPLAASPALLSTAEKVLLAQAVVELGNLDWPAVSTLLSASKALVSDGGDRFTAEVRALSGRGGRERVAHLLLRLVLLWCVRCAV